MKLNKGDILLSKGYGSFFEEIIKMFTRSQYSHVGVVLDNKNDVITIGEALNKGFTIYDDMYHIKNRIEARKIHVHRVPNITTKQTNTIISEAYKLQGKPYDWLDILDIVLYHCTGKIFTFGNAKNVICSEAVAKVFAIAGIELVPGKFCDDVTPADISQSYVIERIYNNKIFKK